MEVAAALARGLKRADPALSVAVLPVADGGDGTVAALVGCGWDRLDVTVTGPEGSPVRASIAMRGNTAVVESATACGLDLLRGGPLSPLTASSRGIGAAMVAAVEAGARYVVVGTGEPRAPTGVPACWLRSVLALPGHVSSPPRRVNNRERVRGSASGSV